jgi:hypothetical protein
MEQLERPVGCSMRTVVSIYVLPLLISILQTTFINISDNDYIYIMEGWYTYSNCTMPVDSYGNTITFVLYLEEDIYYE